MDAQVIEIVLGWTYIMHIILIRLINRERLGM
jgi:hypothetical protein